MTLPLPAFHKGSGRNNWRETEKLGRGRWTPRGSGSLSRLKTFVGNVLRRFRVVFAVLTLVLLSTVIISQTGTLPLCMHLVHETNLTTGVQKQYRASKSLGGGSNFVIVLAANEGGGVMEWKGPREWAIERDSVKNKREYADRWGYQLDIADMSTKKRYAHEWRESWEKVDKVRDAMAKYPEAEW